jgi:Tol biopolymer transport system component
VSDGKRLATLSNRASPTLISPDKTKLAYLLRLTNQAGPEAPQHFELWTGNLDGSNLRVVWNLTEGDNLAWFPDNRRLLLTARDSADQRFGLWVVDTQAAPNQEATLIVESKGLIAATLSSDGAKVVYALTLQGANSGIWLANSDGSQRRKFDWVGGWRWSPANASELFYIPARASGETSSALWSYDTSTAKATRLTDPAALPFQFNLDEWQISPDNKALAYRHAADNALWLLRFRP